MNSPASLRALSGFPVATTHGYQRHRHVHAAASPRQTGAPPPLPPPASQLTQASSPPPWQQQPGDPPRQAGRKQPQQQTTRGGRPWGQQEHVALERQQQGRQPQRAPLPADPQRRQQQQQVSTAPKQQRQGQASQRRMPPPAQQEQQGGVPHRRGVPGQQAAPWAGALVVVEGRNDMRAVRQAAPDADVFVLGTSTLADSRRVLQVGRGRRPAANGLLCPLMLACFQQTGAARPPPRPAAAAGAGGRCGAIPPRPAGAAGSRRGGAPGARRVGRRAAGALPPRLPARAAGHRGRSHQVRVAPGLERGQEWGWSEGFSVTPCPLPVAPRLDARSAPRVPMLCWPPPPRRYHEAGNVGVEHAAPGAIRAALAAARPSDPGRQAFSREDLLRWGLVAELHARVRKPGAVHACTTAGFVGHRHCTLCGL